MHILLSVLGWTLLALLALLALALVLPVRAEIEYHAGALSVRARVFGIPLRVYPFSGGAQKLRSKKKKPKKKAAQSTRKKKKKAPRQELEDIGNLLGAAGTFVRRMYRMIHITGVILILPIHREDAAATAIACGRAEAWLGSMTALLQNYFDLRIVQARTLPDYTNEITAGIYLSCAVGMRPIALVAAGIHALIYLVRQMPAPVSRHKPPDSQQKPPGRSQKTSDPKQNPLESNPKPSAPAAGK